MIKADFQFRILMTVLLCTLVSTASAMDMTDIMEGLSRNKYKQSHFSESKEAFYLDEPLLSEGTIEFKPPDILIKRTIKPVQITQEITRDTIRTISENGEVAVLDLHSQPAVAVLFNTIRGVLTGDKKVIEQNFKTKFKNNNNEWSLSLQPRDEYLRSWFKHILIRGKQYRVRSIKIVEANNDTTIMNIHDPG